ncbi:AfsR/SARP family transcriptional regulator [Streptomyces sp. CA2R106]|uniref:AfsR/SARP family transcriptional regulator n=1 Tax=Streptomyces sp. CA2R106 TaxID=3120153 RepID=UPI0030098FDC
MRFGLLGTVTVVTDDDPDGDRPGGTPRGRPGDVPGGRRGHIPGGSPGSAPPTIGSAKVRALLAALLAAPGRAVPLHQLKSALWGDAPPATATASLHNHVARLRRVLHEDGRDGSRLRAAPSGYVLDVADGEFDVWTFLGHHAAARGAHRAADWTAVLHECRAALALWRGDPLSDVPLRSDALRALAAHLTEARLLTLEWRFDAELALGRHQGLAAELAGLAAAHPMRETFHRQLMLALHRTHRQAEALAVYHRLRRTLVEELGVEPDIALRTAYQEILTAPADPKEPAAGGAGGTGGTGGTGGAEVTAHSAAETAPSTDTAAAGTAAQAGAGAGAGAGTGTGTGSPSQLPADTPDFTGRAAELDVLLAALRGGPERRGPRIAVVSGMGGVGKTALALRAAHLLRAEFPDGRLYADLRGFGAGDARDPADLLARFLGDLGADGQPLPADPDDRAVLWRDALHGRRVLLMLDNAGDAAQVTPLLPGGGDVAVVITSRRALGELPGATRLTLAPLSAGEQRELLVSLCGSRRVAAEPEAAAGVLAACGGLPLALRIAGARMAARPHWPLSALAARLDGPDGARLRALSTGGLAVRDTFAMSYVAMRDSPAPADRAAAEAFRTLGLWPGDGLDAPAAAALLGLGSADAADDVLEALVDAHLLQAPRPGRYRFHDLVGEFAAECGRTELTAGQRRSALRRVTVWYAATVASALTVLAPEGHPLPPLDEQPPLPPVGFAGDEDALHWCVRELPAIKAALTVAVANGWSDVAWRTAAGLFGYAQVYWWNGEWTACLEEAMACVTARGDALGLAWMHSRLGVAHGMAERYGPSLTHLLAARSRFEASGDLHGVAAILTNLTALYRSTGEYGLALEHGRRSLALHRSLGAVDRVATVLGNLGDTHLFAGDPVAAEECYRQALAAWRARGSLTSISRTLTSLAEAKLARGRPAEAVDALTETLALLDRLGDRATAADVLEVLGRAHLARGDRAAARACWQEALDLARAHRLSAEEAAVLRGLAALDAATT